MRVERLRISLVVPTIGRADDLTRLLRSLDAQIYRGFEVIIVDQSGGSQIEDLVNGSCHSFAITRLASWTRGASRARNAGLGVATGDVIAWPDDDAFYPPELLQIVCDLLVNNPLWGGLIGCPVDETGRIHDPRSPTRLTELTTKNVFSLGVEYSLFLRRSVIDEVGGFAETIGPGAGTQWWAGEATDYELRIMGSGRRMFFVPAVKVHHPNQLAWQFDAETRKKLYHYAMGMGAVVRKHQAPDGVLGVRFILYYLGLYSRAVLWAIARGRVRAAHLHAVRLWGVWRGWSTYPAVRERGN